MASIVVQLDDVVYEPNSVKIGFDAVLTLGPIFACALVKGRTLYPKAAIIAAIPNKVLVFIVNPLLVVRRCALFS